MYHLRKPLSKSKIHFDYRQKYKRQDSYDDKEDVRATTNCFNTDSEPFDGAMRTAKERRKRRLRLALIVLGRIGLVVLQLGAIFGA
ncbi:hypothetical protein MRS44_015556 [Fusarium solani]|uniref:uncharacterized protein n=1 Tax=Fusarium solani TaxID=169388 RepID=UPI0032C43F7A|nr:hypothetical protein MRS44_015556 [Fusarium solani]